jgi:hypothetical protein
MTEFKNEYLIGIDITLKTSYFTTILNQEGIYHKFFQRISDALESGVRVLIWTNDLLEINNDKEIVIITTSKSFLRASNGLSFNISNSDLFQINSIGSYPLNIEFKIKRQVFCIEDSGFLDFGRSFDKYKNAIPNSGVRIRCIDKKKYIIFPFDIELEKIGNDCEYRSFFSESTGLDYVEIGPSVDYSSLRELVFSFIIISFNLLNLPLIQLKGPFHNRPVYSIRIDADGYNEHDFNTTLNLATKSQKRFNWFLDFYSLGKYGGFNFLRELKKSNQSINTHSFRHIIYSSYLNNLVNISIAKLINYLTNLDDAGIVSPFGLFNQDYYRVINRPGFSYSSDFGFNVLDLPSYHNNDSENLIQIPSNNASVRTLLLSGFSVSQVFDHLYESTIRQSRKNGFSILYDHPSHGIAAYFDEYEGLLNSLDKQLDYVDIDLIKNQYQNFFKRLVIDSLDRNRIDENEHLFHNRYYDSSININNRVEYLPEVVIGDSVQSRESLISERKKFFKEHFIREYKSSFIEFLFRYLLPSVVIFLFGLIRYQLFRLKK